MKNKNRRIRIIFIKSNAQLHDTVYTILSSQSKYLNISLNLHILTYDESGKLLFSRKPVIPEKKPFKKLRIISPLIKQH
jgi:hypothetical protein